MSISLYIVLNNFKILSFYVSDSNLNSTEEEEEEEGKSCINDNDYRVSKSNL